MIETEFSPLSIIEVKFHDPPVEFTGSDGCTLDRDRSFLEFPGVSICVPIIITEPDRSVIIRAIHADPGWIPDQLDKSIHYAQLHSQTGNVHLEYTERTPSDSSIHPDIFLDQRRLTLLNHLAQLNHSKHVTVTRTPVHSDRLLQHLGYYRTKGFVEITPTD